jgi:hypothetical protein
VRIAVADTDGTDFPFLVCFLHCTVCTAVIAKRLVDQIQIQIIQSQIVKGSLDRLLCSFIAVVLYPELCCDEQFFSCYAALFDCCADCLLI